MDKTISDAALAICAIHSGSSIAVGGFGMCGVPLVLINALRAAGVDKLEIVSNNCGAQGWGLAKLLADRRIRRVIASFFGTNEDFARQYLDGHLEVEITPQGTLAERLRAGGAGIPAFFTPTGVGTVVAEGGMPWRYRRDGSVAVASPAKEVRSFDIDGGVASFVLERAIRTDFALVRAMRGDRHGNLIFHGTAMNFNPLCAMAGRITIAEVEDLCEPGELAPDEIHLPGVYVDHVVELTPEQAAEKPVEFRMIREEMIA
ncbi:3-oxoacid CoA-transferase, A subunit [Mycolicibacterium aurum]|uniref:3-oxoacid CoA-transferase, A subunit n=1 Tax=Mycolicibacterium aurum TaxID=1791 RepID=A0A448IJP1_MYCAU|nr:CoA transferase subunit A [Mycolicibacterium aurum]VEG52646.1 3-oxoacid CoA-transferase, A subunit [Mycolicibacterium aurum]